MSVLVFLVTLFGNFWIWRAFKINSVVGIAVMLTSVALFIWIRSKSKLFMCFSILLLVSLSIFQVNLTQVADLKNFSNDEVRIKDMRLREYPPTRFPFAHWFEERSETVALFRVEKNFFEVIDPNLYFFGNYPRGRVGFEEFEKFNFVFLPFFVLGAYKLFERKNYPFFVISFLFPVLVLSIIGNKSMLGPFLIFPFIVNVVVYPFIKE